MSQFPRLYQYTDILAKRDAGILLVVMIVIAAVALLVDARFLWPRALPIIRAGLLAAFYISTLALVAIQLLRS